MSPVARSEGGVSLDDKTFTNDFIRARWWAREILNSTFIRTIVY